MKCSARRPSQTSLGKGSLPSVNEVKEDQTEDSGIGSCQDWYYPSPLEIWSVNFEYIGTSLWLKYCGDDYGNVVGPKGSVTSTDDLYKNFGVVAMATW